MNSPEFEAFTNHWTACPNCKPRYGHYCKTGRELHIDYNAAFVCGLETLALRQHWIEQIAKMNPDVEAIKKRVLEKSEIRKNEKS